MFRNYDVDVGVGGDVEMLLPFIVLAPACRGDSLTSKFYREASDSNLASQHHGSMFLNLLALLRSGGGGPMRRDGA